MAKLTVEEQKDFPVLPVDSILHLKVEDNEVRDVDGRNGRWQKLEFKFKILGIQHVGDGSPAANYESLISTHIWGSVPFRLTDSAENRLRLWGEAILGVPMGVGFELDTDDFLSRQVRGVTTQYEKRSINPVTGQPFKAHQIGSLLPMGSHQAQQQQQSQATQAANPWATPAASSQNSPWGQQPATQAAGFGGFEEDPPF